MWIENYLVPGSAVEDALKQGSGQQAVFIPCWDFVPQRSRAHKKRMAIPKRLSPFFFLADHSHDSREWSHFNSCRSRLSFSCHLPVNLETSAIFLPLLAQ